VSATFQGIRRLFCDTSFLYACLAPDDAWHGRAMELAAEAPMPRQSFHLPGMSLAKRLPSCAIEGAFKQRSAS
jgi:hypothetical protein